MLAEVEQLCHRAIVIQNGHLVTVAELENGCLDAEEVTLTFRVDAVEPAVAVGKRTEGVQIIRTDFIRNQLVVKMSNADVPRMVLESVRCGCRGIPDHRERAKSGGRILEMDRREPDCII